MVKPKEGGISASWERDVKMTFCDICLHEIELGNRPTSHFNKEGWINITKNFQDKTGREYDKGQLKNKWDQLKKDWKLWKELIRGSTGLGWDPKRKTIDASDDWWKEKLLVVPNAKKFKYCGIDPELEDKLDVMFMGIVATGTESWTPNQIPEDMDTPTYSEQPHDIDLGEDLLQNKEDIPECSHSRKRSCSSLTVGRKKKNEATFLRNQITELVNSCTQISSRSNSCQETDEQPLLSDAIKELDRILDLFEDITIYLFATKLLEVRKKREIFMSMVPERRVYYIRYCYENRDTM